jgi:methionine synthase II (cobalamin-independent)
MNSYQTPLQFPLLDTFPDTLFEMSQRGQEGINMSAALACGSGMKDRILDLRNATCRFVQLDEREALYNDLTQMSQNYSIGYESGSDSGVDDE